MQLTRLELTAPRSEAAVALARFLDDCRVHDRALSQLAHDQRSASEAVTRIGNELTHLERRAALGEAVSTKERRDLEGRYDVARAAANTHWAAKREGLLAAQREARAAVYGFTSTHFAELRRELEEDAARSAEAVNDAAVALVEAIRERGRVAQQVESLAQLVFGRTEMGDVAVSRSGELAVQVGRFINQGGEVAPVLSPRFDRKTDAAHPAVA